jgi:hypothetical protein
VGDRGSIRHADGKWREQKNQDGKPVNQTKLAIPVSLRSYFFFLPFFFFAATSITSDPG